MHNSKWKSGCDSKKLKENSFIWLTCWAIERARCIRWIQNDESRFFSRFYKMQRNEYIALRTIHLFTERRAYKIISHISCRKLFGFFLSSSEKLFSVSPRLIRSGSVNATQCWWWVNMFLVPFEFFVNKKIITFLWFRFSKYLLGFFMHLAFWFHRSMILLFYFYSCFGVPFAGWFIRFHWEFWRV